MQDGGSSFDTVLEVFETDLESAVACARDDPELHGCSRTNAVVRASPFPASHRLFALSLQCRCGFRGVLATGPLFQVCSDPTLGLRPARDSQIRDLAMRAHMVYWIVLLGARDQRGDFAFTLTSLRAPPTGWRSPTPQLRSATQTLRPMLIKKIRCVRASYVLNGVCGFGVFWATSGW